MRYFLLHDEKAFDNEYWSITWINYVICVIIENCVSICFMSDIFLALVIILVTKKSPKMLYILNGAQKRLLVTIKES